MFVCLFLNTRRKGTKGCYNNMRMNFCLFVCVCVCVCDDVLLVPRASNVIVFLFPFCFIPSTKMSFYGKERFPDRLFHFPRDFKMSLDILFFVYFFSFDIFLEATVLSAGNIYRCKRVSFSFWKIDQSINLSFAQKSQTSRLMSECFD